MSGGQRERDEGDTEGWRNRGIRGGEDKDRNRVKAREGGEKDKKNCALFGTVEKKRLFLAIKKKL